jgi:predicted dehydrogenase
MNRSSDPLNIAIVGPGRMGRLYTRIVEELATTHLVAICGNGEASTKSVAEQHGVPHYTGAQYGSLLANHPEIEAVIVSASEYAHTEAVLAAIDAGKHVLVEKPMATSALDAAEMVQRGEQAGIHLMVCHSLRFDARFAAMRQAVTNGAIGEILHMYARRNPPQIAVERVLGRFSLAYWLAPHDIDMMLWTVGSPVRTVKAYSRSGAKERQDFIIAVLTFASGAVGILENSWGTPGHSGYPINELFSVRGTEGVAEVVGHPHGVAIYRVGSDPEYPDTNYTPVIHDQQEGMFRSLVRHFASVVRDQCPPVITGHDGLAAIRVAAALERALVKGEEVPL